jgi:23S rRNA G2445 N2-methylase RlmL
LIRQIRSPTAPRSSSKAYKSGFFTRKMMFGLGIVSRGAEEAARLEVAELLDVESDVKETAVKFQVNDKRQLCRLSYRTQSMSRVLELLSEIQISEDFSLSLAAIEKALDDKELDRWLKGKKFRIECERHGTHGFTSVDMEKEIVRILKDRGHSADFDAADIAVYLYVQQDRGYFGIDYAGFDMSKRQYKIFNHPEAMKGNTAYALLRLGEYSRKKIILDPFMGSGIILIEAALFASGFPVQFYSKDKLFFTRYGLLDNDQFFKEEDKFNETGMKILGFDRELRHLSSTQKNAKLAGVDKMIAVSRCEIEWLDTKLDKSSVDMMITDPPRISKRDEKKAVKTYQELFYQAEYILKKAGKVVIFAKSHEEIIKAAEKHKFKINASYALNQGKESFDVMIFRRD